MNPLNKLPIPLLAWYRDNARVLPWRSVPTPYRVWVSEIMLQQTRVAAVLDYFARFMNALPTVAELAGADEDRLLKLWQGLGYYNRARNLQKAAGQIMNDFGGDFPQTYDEIITLAGVGEYTAGAIASIAFGIPVPAVDGNVLRVISRITGDDGDIMRPDTKSRMRAALLATMPKNAAGDFNQALMELGAMLCLPNGAPKCDTCPAAGFCRALLDDKIGTLPVKTPKKARRVEERTVYLMFRDGQVALRRRPEQGLLAKLWEYPNELAAAPPPIALAERTFAARGKHIFTHIEWHMTAVIARPAGPIPPDWVWADREALRLDYAVPNAFQSFTHLVEEHL